MNSHYGCNSNEQHEKCETCPLHCENRNRFWFGNKNENKLYQQGRTDAIDGFVSKFKEGLRGKYPYWLQEYDVIEQLTEGAGDGDCYLYADYMLEKFVELLAERMKGEQNGRI